MRRDICTHTPAFKLTAEQIAICHTQVALGWLDATLEVMIRDHLYAHRPIVGIFRSLDGIGFGEDFDANRAAHMAEAHAEWERVNFVPMQVAA